jgi:hypothetical protein
MESDKLLDLLIQNIDKKVEQLQEALGAFSAKSFEEYSSMCGEIKGLLTSRRYMVDLKHSMES